MQEHRMVIIDDLEPIEAEIIQQFLQDAVSNGDLELAIQDCITIRDEVKFHDFVPQQPNSDWCKICNHSIVDTIHMTKAYEVEQ